MISSSKSSKRRLARRAQRGAAMIEAIVIMLTLLVFLGMNLFAVKAYGGKFDQATAVRRDAMYYATHNCNQNNDSDPDTYVDPSLRGAGGVSGDGGYAADLAALLTSGIRNWLGLSEDSLDFGAARTTRSSALQGDAVIWTSKRQLTSNVRTSSIVQCNEKPYYEGLLGTLRDLGWDFVQDVKNLW